nr:hypothetical protein [Tanacetum cinerariifolium]
IDVEQVLVVVAAAHVVGARQLVVADYAWQGFEDGVEVPKRRRQDLGRAGVELNEADLLAAVGRVGAAPHGYVLKRLGLGLQRELQGLAGIGGQAQGLAQRL